MREGCCAAPDARRRYNQALAGRMKRLRKRKVDY
jgi:hypothetical protein